MSSKKKRNTKTQEADDRDRVGARSTVLDVTKCDDIDPETFRLTTRGKTLRHQIGERADHGNRWDGRPVDALIFEGGGTKGMVYGGVTKRLDEAGLLGGVRCFAGTSAGAQTAALCAIGYSGGELVSVMQSAPWASLLDGSHACGCCGCFPNMRRLWREFGLYKGDVLQAYLEKLVEKKCGRRDFTLQDLYVERGVILRVGACNITRRRFEMLDFTTHPNMPIAVAGRASSSIPVVFVPVMYRTRAGLDMMYVDGGLEGNMPTKAFPGKRALAFNLKTHSEWGASSDRCAKPETLQRFMTTIADMVINSAQSVGGVNQDVEDDTLIGPRTSTSSASTVQTRNASKDKGGNKLSANSQQLGKQGIFIISVDCLNHGMLEPSLPKEEVDRMVAAGWDAVDDFIDGQEPLPPQAGSSSSSQTTSSQTHDKALRNLQALQVAAHLGAQAEAQEHIRFEQDKQRLLEADNPESMLDLAIEEGEEFAKMLRDGFETAIGQRLAGEVGKPTRKKKKQAEELRKQFSTELSCRGKVARRQAGERFGSSAWKGTPFEALIFEGGGTKAIVYGGALRRLDDAGLLRDIKCFAGSSTGAIVAALCAVGCTPDEFTEWVTNAPWGSMADDSGMWGCFGFIHNFWRLKKHYGICKGETISAFLDDFIAKKYTPGAQRGARCRAPHWRLQRVHEAVRDD
eukprot:TRINITY_DN24515_c0_g1_i2.p1 TRINITY_DN24515_c0_g1~~TRINITY_DN24515_c0_g1_i2.p1  ORF type:complete len:685 (-),score=128.14 TRINITY_DN24515_c0_g1_i2:739-2793(-)